MKVETSISRIEALTRHRKDADRRYRCLLKGRGLKSAEVDAVVRKHSRAVSRQIDCRKCANCCKVFRPLLTSEDIGRLARRLEIPREDFVRAYLVEYEDGSAHVFKRTPCPFLAHNACTVYSDRPSACRAYPGLDKKGFVLRLDQAFASCSVCPIVFNVYERVKREILSSLVPGERARMGSQARRSC